ncbi:hypothetical protein [Arthrobacter cupressi]|uniref:Uncharacterized protein n=1 Tax=Arthrobacter cupressi TaxID=1045773 RepID=A0A1G8V6R3_9MICC|nr:hypothetical protein [Arthrobacter cupressi]NYD78674.1 hypothetical protein [Arthrobacter cupressi]SDJ61689.1 hypothetical protein SAMN05216555_11366 [Arthrobacter cupressi]
MGIDVLVTVLICVGVVFAAIWSGTRMVSRGGLAKGATGTFGSVLGMIDPATGAPTKVEAAAAREEMKQQRHQVYSEGPGGHGVELIGGKVTLPEPNSKRP